MLLELWSENTKKDKNVQPSREMKPVKFTTRQFFDVNWSTQIKPIEKSSKRCQKLIKNFVEWQRQGAFTVTQFQIGLFWSFKPPKHNLHCAQLFHWTLCRTIWLTVWFALKVWIIYKKLLSLLGNRLCFLSRSSALWKDCGIWIFFRMQKNYYNVDWKMNNVLILISKRVLKLSFCPLK